MAAFEDIKKVGVIGAGTMGRGIVMNFVNAGYPVTWLDVNGEMLEKGLVEIAAVYKRSVAQERFDDAEAQARVARISTTQDYADLADMDLVVEAVYENMDLKKKIFAELDKAVKPSAILATNTSYLDIDEIASATQRPTQVLGLHFFSPAHIMKLLEVVRGKATAQDVMDACLAVGKKIGKEAVLAGNCHGFIGNRMLAGYTRQAGEIILQGATPYQVDNAILGFGMPMGPFQMNDLVGLDLGWRARKLNGIKPEDVPITARVADKLCEMDRYGQKTSRGYYIYPEGSRAGTADPEVVQIVEETSAELGIERRPIDDDEVLKRCLYPMINEGARILADGIAIRPCDIDIVYINGYGFPEVTGGPMFWADQIGLDNILADIKKFEAEYGGDIWKPAPLLEKLVAEGKNFASLQG